MLKTLSEANVLELSDMDALSLIALARLPYDWEIWCRGDVRSARQALRSIYGHLLAVPPLPILAQDEDILVAGTVPALNRFFRVVLERDAYEKECERWLAEAAFRLSILASTLFGSPEAAFVDTVSPVVTSIEDELRRQQFVSSIMQRDVYARRVWSRSSEQVLDSRRQLEADSNIKIGVSIHISAADIERCRQSLSAIFPSSTFLISHIEADQITDDRLSGLDIFFAIHHHFYIGYDEKFAAIKKAGCVSACWHWDNHHQFELACTFANNVDYVFPAHSNGALPLQNGSAIGGQVVPCSVFQWSVDDALELIPLLYRPRSNRLYGRFQSYGGRNGLRDLFLDEVASRLADNAIQVLRPDENAWFALSSSDKFRELSSYKIVLCNPIYFDLPARLFDALLAGAIPIVPNGLSDIDMAISFVDQRELPILKYRPDDIRSLEAACARGLKLFDELGPDGIRRRSEAARTQHMVTHRLTRILSEVYQDCMIKT